MSHEQVFTLEATPLKFGRGAAADAGWELERLGVKRAMLVSDPGVVAAGITDRVRERIEASGIETEVWDRARVEPTAASFEEAAAFAADGGFDGFVGHRRRVEHRHRQGLGPDRHARRRGHGLRQRAGRRGSQAVRRR